MIANAKSTPNLNQHLSRPALLLRLEGLTIFLISLGVYAHQDYSWLTFALLFFAPDLVFIVYAINNKAGVIAYNFLHTYTLPLVLFAGSFVFSLPLGIQISLIWLAHIGLDRLVGYGLKYQDNFKNTHLNQA